ncbi:arylsulfatase [Haloferula sp. A504]|uniref:arylsulfatase n=1 Tax=Haloferula sp. A504 TaxID=3373601 RepID=UPI0031BC4885|nr:arylsulfatase [Verrucomicrobiaceae bacterium E54]
MKSLVRIFMGLSLVSCLGAAPPNILLIFADDLGFGDISCYNPEAKIETPHLDRLAGEGLRFTDAHSPSTVCTPSRYSLLTGRMAFRIPYRGVFTGAGGPCLIEEGRLTLPEMLREKGYRTALFGKWHIGMTFFDKDGKPIHKDGLEPVKRIDYSRAIEGGPVSHGFDEFFGTACCPTTDWLYAFIDGDRIPVPPTKLLDRSTLPEHPWSFDCREGLIAPDFDMEEIDEIFLGKSIGFLESHAKEKPDQPFFLMHSTQAVHLPSFPSKRFQGTTGKGAHGDFIAQFDGHVGDLMKALDRLELAKNTIVIVTSDNGPEVGTVIHMRDLHDHDGARPWRGVKRDNWEGGHRVPMLVRWPGVSPAGRTIRETVCLTDLFATLAEVTGFELPETAGEDSVSVLPLLKGRDAPVREFTLHQTWSLDLAIRRGPWKYLDHKGSGGNRYDRKGSKNWSIPEDWIIEDTAPDTPGQLYDLATDPGETVNLVERYPERVAELKKLLDETRGSGRSAPTDR